MFFRQIHHAAQHPVNLDQAQADAVEARTRLDLRTGAAFTRMQSNALQARIPQLERTMVSYGVFFDISFYLLCSLRLKALANSPHLASWSHDIIKSRVLSLRLFGSYIFRCLVHSTQMTTKKPVSPGKEGTSSITTLPSPYTSLFCQTLGPVLRKLPIKLPRNGKLASL